MKKNLVIIIAVIAVSVATVKTGYAFYGKQISNNQTNENQVTNNGGSYQGGVAQTDFYARENIPELASETPDPSQADRSAAVNDPTLAASGQADDSFDQGNCCGSGSVDMLDENGNLKDLETFSKELDEAVQNGELTEDDKEYYLYMYDQCAVVFGAGSSDSSSVGGTQGGAGGSNGSFPSCH